MDLLDPHLEQHIFEFLYEDSSSSSSSKNTSSDETDSDSDSSLEKHIVMGRRSHTRLKNFVESVVARYDEIDFQEHFRMERTTVDYLIGKISLAHVLPEHTYGRRPVTPKKAILLTIWYLANAETFRQVSDMFDVCKSCAYVVVKKITDYFVINSKDYIKWPSEEESIQHIEAAFYNKGHIHGVIGAIDGSHIKIKRPANDQEAFYNRKGYHSIVIQAVCDNEKRFTEIFCGEAGSQHDGRVLRKSNLYRRAEEGNLNLGNLFLLGDSAYPVLPWLIPPFKDNGHLTNNHINFNKRHSSTRIVIEHSFGLLKSRFRRLLHGFDNFNIGFIVACVICACVFHNICINLDDLNIEILEVLAIQNIGINPIPDHLDGVNRRQLLFQEMFG